MFTNHETAAQSTRRYVDRKLLPQRSSNSFERRAKKEENIVHGAECFSGAPLPEMLLLSSDLAHLCLMPSTFENSTFFVRS